MIELKLSRTVLRFDFSFFSVLAMFFWLDSSGFGLTALGICVAHELSHLAVMTACGIIPENITFYGAGIRIASTETAFRPAAVQATVYSAGCIMNFLLAIVTAASGMPYIAAVSVSCGLFNLAPIGEFDGRKLLRLLMIHIAPAENIDKIMRLSGICSGIIIAAFLLVCGKEISPTFVITLAYIIFLSVKKY